MNEKIKVAGIEYEIKEFSNEEMKGTLGLADFNKQLISLNKESTDTTKKIAVYHEIIHILDNAFGLDLSERQVKYLTHAIIAFIQENPEFIANNR